MKKNKLICIFVAIVIAPLFSNTLHAQWTPKANIPGSGRWAPQYFALDGKIYIGGGYVGNFVNQNDFHQYDTATNTWTSKGNLPGTVTMRTGGVAFVVNGKAYLGLGASDYNNFNPQPTFLKDLWEYNAAANTWAKKTDLPGDGRADAAVFVVNNKAYIIGGTTKTGAGGAQTDQVWEYNPATDKWTAKSAFSVGALYKAAGFTLNGKGYIIGAEITGGTTPVYSEKLYEYNPTADSWTPKASLPATATPRSGGVAFVVNNKAYFGLGQTTSGTTATFYNDFFVYNPTSNMWNKMTGITGNGRAYGMAVGIGNRAYVGSGWSRSGSNQAFYNQFYEVNPATLNVQDMDSETSVKVYPNPVADMLYINAGKHEAIDYNLYNCIGQKALSGSMGPEHKIDVSSLPAGQYILEVVAGDRYNRLLVSVVH